MGATLSEIPFAKRRQVAGALGLFSLLFVAIGAVAATGADSGLLTAFVTVAFVVAVLLALLAWGVLASVRTERAERRHEAALDAAVAQALAAAGQIGPHDCGHEHDPDELHVTGDPCEHDGVAAQCSQTCDTCVFARVAPGATDSRPRPTPSR